MNRQLSSIGQEAKGMPGTGQEGSGEAVGFMLNRGAGMVSSAEAVEQLTSVFELYSAATDRMQEAYDQLQRDVIRLRQELAQKNAQLERKNRLAALGEMAAGLAHEIRNPLGGVQLYASLLENDLRGQEVPLQWVEKISKGVRSLDRIVGDILSFAQDQSCVKTEVNLAGLVADALDYIQPQLRASGVRVGVEGIERAFMIQADVTMMRQVLINLLLNAVEASVGVGAVTVEAGRVEGDTRYGVWLSVSDAGEGIREKDMEKIFNPFFTTKENGVGLGLAIVHRLVECQGGEVSVSNHTGGGARFLVKLP